MKHSLLKKTITILFLSFFICSVSYAQIWRWADAFNIPSNDIPRFKIAVDDSSNVFYLGHFEGNVSMGSFTLISKGKSDVFLAKLNSKGKVLWATSWGSDSIDYETDIKIDQSGNLIIVGSYTHTINLGGFTLNAAHEDRLFIAKFNSSGNLIWIKNPANAGCLYWGEMQLDTNGDIYLTGSYRDSAQFGGTKLLPVSSNPLNVYGFTSMYVAKFDSVANVIWARTTIDSVFTSSYSFSLEFDPIGNVYVCGWFSGDIDFGSGNLSSSGYDTFLVKYNKSGNLIWAKKYGGLGDQRAMTIAFDSYGNGYMEGAVSQTTTFDSFTFTGSGSFLLKFTGNGNAIWVKKLGGSTNYDFTIDEKDQIYISGYIAGPNNYFNEYIPSHKYGVFVAKHDTNGNLLWFQQADAGNNVFDIKTDTTGNCYIMGNHNISGGKFGLIPVSGVFGNSSFIAKLQQEGNSVKGMVYNDIDSSTTFTTNESKLNSQTIRVLPGPLYYGTNDTGSYTVFLDTGNYTIESVLPKYWQQTVPFAPSFYSASFNSLGQSLLLKDFGLKMIPKIKDAEIVITDLTPARVSYPVSYKIAAKNIGSETIKNGKIVMKYDSSLTFLSSSLTPILSQGDSIVWNYDSLPSYKMINIQADFTVDPNPSLDGSSLFLQAKVYPFINDVDTSNNTSYFEDYVTSSYDPNYKTVSPYTGSDPYGTGYLPSSTSQFTYTIHFQNTGTDTAINIHIVDPLDTIFDLSTFNMLASSHPCTFVLESNLNGERMVRWDFKNIMLPDSSKSYDKSCGFVKFSIKPKRSLINGDIMQNDALIYFDVNPPVLTNKVVSTINDAVIGIKTHTVQDPHFLIYPNPAHQFAFMNYRLTENSKVSLVVYDLIGKKIAEIVNEKQLAGEHRINFDTSNLLQGVYCCRLLINGQLQMREKLIIIR